MRDIYYLSVDFTTTINAQPPLHIDRECAVVNATCDKIPSALYFVAWFKSIGFLFSFETLRAVRSKKVGKLKIFSVENFTPEFVEISEYLLKTP